jgi:hypothetical protein
MFRSMVAGTTTAAICGLTCSVIASIIWGTASLPFIFGSTVGFTIGSIRWYHISTEEALISLQAYPALFRLHLMSNYPSDRRFRTWELAQFRPQVFERSWVLKSMLVASWLTARSSMQEIQTREEAKVIEGYAEDITNEKR